MGRTRASQREVLGRVAVPPPRRRQHPHLHRSLPMHSVRLLLLPLPRRCRRHCPRLSPASTSVTVPGVGRMDLPLGVILVAVLALLVLACLWVAHLAPSVIDWFPCGVVVCGVVVCGVWCCGVVVCGVSGVGILPFPFCFTWTTLCLLARP
jgi:hypothetical protein